MKVCLDLFCGLGGFSAAFADADDWSVVTVDIEEQFDPDLQADVFDLRPADLLDALPVNDWDDMDTFVALAGEPCTYFSPARNITEGGDDAWNGDQPATEASRRHVAMAHHTVGLLEAMPTDWWFLENPVGRLRTVLGQPSGTITQCQYGRDGMKPTDLWGDHPPTFRYESCKPGDDCHTTAGSYTPDESQARLGTLAESDDAAVRSLLPYDLSQSILDAVKNPEAGTILSDEWGADA